MPSAPTRVAKGLSIGEGCLMGIFDSWRSADSVRSFQQRFDPGFVLHLVTI